MTKNVRFFQIAILVILIDHSICCDTSNLDILDCKYIQENCSASDSIINYLEIYYCYISSTPIYILLISVWIITLFYTLFLVADQNFTISLQNLAVYLKLSPDLAGITLLAFGNGATDFFTALAGSDDAPILVIGNSIGSTICILSLIFGLVLWYGQDYHYEDLQSSEIESSLVMNKSLLLKTSTYSQQKVEQSKLNPDVLMIQGKLFIRNYLLLFASVGAFIAIIFFNEVYFIYPMLLVIWFIIYLITVISQHIHERRNKIYEQSIEQQDVRNSINNPMIDEDFVRHSEVFNGSYLEAFLVINSFSEKNIQQWITFILQSIPCLVVKLVLLPLGLTEDDREELEFKQQLAKLKMNEILSIINPLFSGALLFLIFERDLSLKAGEAPLWSIYLGVSLCVSLFIYVTNAKDHLFQPKFYFFRVMYVFGMCIICLYQTSCELVAALLSISIIFSIPNGLLGLTVLSWGNSFGDLVSNFTLAKQGSFQTVSTSIFASPLQNILLTIGSNFLIVALKSDNQKIIIGELDNLMLISIGFLGFILIFVGIAIVNIYRFKVRRGLGIYLAGYYVLFLITIIIVNSLGKDE